MSGAIERIEPGSRMSAAVVNGGAVYISGQVAGDTNEGVAGQTRQVLAKIDALLARAGTDKSKLLSATVWLSDIASYDEMNAVWDAWIDENAPPARACVQSTLAGPRYRVEIAAIAARPW